MRTLVQISDLHFGRVDPALLGPLRDTVIAAKPDVVAVSGDLTQRARTKQFQEAAAYLATLPKPQIVVPGNHDVPLYDVVRRFAAPLDRFRKYIEADPFPTHVDDEIAVVGVNTARSFTFKDGRINAEQIAEVERIFKGLPEAVTRIVVTHHPFDVADDHKRLRDLVAGADIAMDAFAGAGVDVFLSGHLHHSLATSTAKRYRIDGFAALTIQAGTTTSTRTRDDGNAFNVMRIEGDVLELETWAFIPERKVFERREPQRFAYASGSGWAPQKGVGEKATS